MTILLKAPNSLFFKMPFLLTKIGNSKNVIIYICYVIEFIVSYREITNSRFSLNQSKPYISKFLGPIKRNKERLK